MKLDGEKGWEMSPNVISKCKERCEVPEPAECCLIMAKIIITIILIDIVITIIKDNYSLI